jgi:hypothetical protein
MKLILIFLLLFSTARAQRFIARPVIQETADTIIYHSHGQTYAVYKFKDGSACVQDKTGVAYYSRRYYRRWKRKYVKL